MLMGVLHMTLQAQLLLRKQKVRWRDMMRMNLLLITALGCCLFACSPKSELTPKQMTELQCDVLQGFMTGRNIGSDAFQTYIHPVPVWPTRGGVVETADARMAYIDKNRTPFRKAGVKRQTIDGYKRIQKMDFSLSDCSFTGTVWNTQEGWEMGKVKSKTFSFHPGGEPVSLNGFSRVGFNKAKTQGIFFWSMNCNGGNCHTSAQVVMKKVRGVWIEDEFLLGSVG